MQSPDESANPIVSAGDATGAEQTSEAPSIEAPSIETTAREQGWVDKESYEGPAESWVAAEEFVKRRPLIDKLKAQNKKLRELEKTVDSMAKHYTVTVEQARKQAIEQYKAERKEAIELGDSDKVEVLDEKIDQLKQQPAPPTAGLSPEINDFIESNKSWFNVDQEMTDFAVSYNETFLRRNNDLTLSLEETMKAVKRAFPEKFQRAKPAVQSVEGVAPAAASQGKYGMQRLSPEQKLAYNQFVKVHKTMSHDEYFKSLDDAGFLN